MKKILILIIGLLIAYPLYYYIAHNNGLLHKIPYGIVTFCSFFIFISGLVSRLKDKSFYKAISQITLIAPICLSIITYETFDLLTFGSKEEQAELLTKSKNIAVGKIMEIEHFDSYLVKGKNIPEHWELIYEFMDSSNQIFKGVCLTNILPSRKIGDTLMIKYVKENPEVNKQVKK